MLYEICIQMRTFLKEKKQQRFIVKALSQYSFDDEYLYCIECLDFFRKKVIVAHLKAKQCVYCICK